MSWSMTFDAGDAKALRHAIEHAELPANHPLRAESQEQVTIARAAALTLLDCMSHGYEDHVWSAYMGGHPVPSEETEKKQWSAQQFINLNVSHKPKDA